MGFFVTMFEYFNFYWKWANDNLDKVHPTSASIYFYFLHVANELHWKPSFSISSTQVMNYCGIGNYKTYKRHFDELVENGLIEIVKKTNNQYTANVIALVKNTEPNTEALPNQIPKQVQSTYQSTAYINKSIEEDKDFKDVEEVITVSDSIESKPTKKNREVQFNATPYYNNPDLFAHDWNNSSGANKFPSADPYLIYEKLKDATDATTKYKYVNWIAAAKNWVASNPKQYNRNNLDNLNLGAGDRKLAEFLSRPSISTSDLESELALFPSDIADKARKGLTDLQIE